MANIKITPTTLWAAPNIYGYIFNLNHSHVSRAYKQYQQEHGLDIRIPMTDAQRHAFESELLEKLKAGEFIIPPHIDRKNSKIF